MSLKPSLYFIALIPHNELAEKITLIKNDFARNFQSNKSLKVMPHITLQNPFIRMESQETELHLRLEDFFSKINSFKIQLSGYGCFDNEKNKVVFIDVVKNEFLFELHKKFIYFSREEMNFSNKETSYAYHPHITVASKDLSADQFIKAWGKYKSKTFEGIFTADSVYLLKHNFRNWDVLSKFDLRK